MFVCGIRYLLAGRTKGKHNIMTKIEGEGGMTDGCHACMLYERVGGWKEDERRGNDTWLMNGER